MRDRRHAWLGRLALCGVALLPVVGPSAAQAQQVELAFDEGLVTLVARDVTVKQILDEWARRGKTVVVNADLLGQERVSLELDRVVEAKAIDRILQSAAGYVARRRAGTDGPSDYGLILVLADSDSPAAIAAALGDGDLASPATDDLGPDAAPPDGTGGTEPPTESVSEPDDEEDISSNEANGRDPAAKPDERLVAPGDPLNPVPAEDLPVGRPEGARPGTPSPAAPTSAAPASAEAVAPVPSAAPAAEAVPGDGSPTDINGRTPRKPKP